MVDEKFWVENPFILIEKIFQVIPKKNMMPIEKLNTIMRYFIYAGVGVGLYTNKMKNGFMIILLGAIITILYSKNMPKQKMEDGEIEYRQTNEYYLMGSDALNYVREPFQTVQQNQSSQPRQMNDITSIDDERQQNNRFIPLQDSETITRRMGITTINTSDVIESEYNTFEINRPEMLVKQLQVNDTKCIRPSINNPLMNPLTATDTDPCNITDPDIAAEVKQTFYNDIYRDVDDIYQRKNSERQFYAIPKRYDFADQEIFSKWLFNNQHACKQNPKLCTGFN